MKLIVFDIGGTEIKYGIIEDGVFLLKDSFQTPTNYGDDLIMSAIINKTKILKKEFKVNGVAISSAGVIDPQTGQVVAASNTIFDYLGTKIKEMMETETNLTTWVENDVNCVGLAEGKIGAAQNNNYYLSMTIGTGIGGAIYIDKKLINGTSYSAGEWGLMQFNGNKFEDIASVSSLVLAAQKIYPTLTNGKEIFELYDNGDHKIVEVINTFYSNLALGISNLIYAFNPEAVIIGGGITNRPTFISELRTALKKILPPYFYNSIEIKGASLKNDAGMMGAFYNFINK